MKDVARPDIQPAFAERNVPVVLATDGNFLPYLKVAVNSAIANASGSNLDILVLCAGIPEEAIRTFVAGYAGVGRASVRFVDISAELEASGLSDYKQTDRLPLSSCYRLLLPRVLPAYGKVVYIDVDVAVCRDLGELHATDVGDSYFAAAKDVVCNTHPEYVSWAAKWGFAEWEDYVNTGVLVMNLARFRREPVFDRLKEIVFEAAKWNCDQDALNFVCKGAIAPLDPRWNVQLGDYCLEKQIALTGEEMWIAHYTAGRKPWTYPARRYSHLWWRHVDASDVPRLWKQAWGETLVSPDGETPKLSVVMPVWNAAKYLPEALASVLMQKDAPALEVICVDDGSTDASAEIAAFWQARDARLKVIRQANQGPGAARNAGLDAARGEYVFFLDADDRLSSGAALRAACEQAAADDLDMLFADGSVIAENGETEGQDVFLDDRLAPAERVFAPEALGIGLYMLTPMWPHATLFRRAFLADNRLRFPSSPRSEGFPMVQLAVTLARRIGCLRQTLFDRRTGAAASRAPAKDGMPPDCAEAEALFRRSLAEHGLLARFAPAADVAFLRHLDRTLRRVGRFSAFRAIATYCAGKFPALALRGDELDVPAYAQAFRTVAAAAAAADDVDALADVFAALRDDRRRVLAAWHARRVAQLKKEKTALWKRLKAAAQGKADLAVQVKALAQKQTELWREKMAAVKTKGDLWRRLQAKEAERRRLAELVQRLTKAVE